MTVIIGSERLGRQARLLPYTSIMADLMSGGKT
jgi:hypothetical protein